MKCAVILCAVLIGYVRGQLVATTQSPQQPPNCVCTQPTNMVASSNSNSASNGMGGMRGMGGRGHKSKGICTNLNQNYTTRCDLVNAMALNQGLGTRPCRTNMTMSNNQAMQNGNGMRGQWKQNGGSQRQMPVCFTNNQSGSYTHQDLNTFLQSNPTVGIRCKQACPCPALQCPRQRGGGRGRWQQQ
ncbi:uncharacterized protein LOC129598870 [Paramacrobiotus metropolitanus]|uniref:uncharacterized protein LOC129598870 n=1 Tax=Paramacrobiotus metropolitanus TaxID=2943436 RepID=UPI00244607FA|nr:uncharacterized protein LOC129598870 [Paramacrobiotus metropolitanus]